MRRTTHAALPEDPLDSILTALIDRIDLLREALEIRVRPAGLPSVLDGSSKPPNHDRADEHTEPTITFTVKARLKRTGMEMRLLIDGPAGNARKKPDHSLCRLLAQAHRYNAMVMQSAGKTMSQLAVEAGVGGFYFARILRLSFLPPEVMRAILQDRYSFELTAKRLANEIRIPLAWSEQLSLIGLD